MKSLVLIIAITVISYRAIAQSSKEATSYSALQGSWIQLSRHKGQKIKFDGSDKKIQITKINGIVETYLFKIRKDSLFIADSLNTKVRFYFPEKNLLEFEFPRDSINFIKVRYRKYQGKK